MHRVLLALARAGGPVKCRDLARQLGYQSNSTVSILVGRLRELDLVEPAEVDVARQSQLRSGYRIRPGVVVGDRGFVGRVTPVDLQRPFQEAFDGERPLVRMTAAAQVRRIRGSVTIPPMLSTSAAAAYLGLSRRRVLQLVEKGRLRSRRLEGGRQPHAFEQADLDRVKLTLRPYRRREGSTDAAEPERTS